MDIDEIKQIIENGEAKVVIVENGKPVMVVMNFDEYKKSLKKNNSPKLFSFSNFNLDKHLPEELQEEELKIEDLPF